MTKTVCDICGKEMPTSKFPDTIENLNLCISSYGKIWDTCPECRVSLDKWMTMRGKSCDERECSYKTRSENRMKLIIDIPDGVKVSIDRVGLLRIPDEQISEIGVEIQNGKPFDVVLDKLKADVEECIRHSRHFTTTKACCGVRDDVLRVIDEYR